MGVFPMPNATVDCCLEPCRQDNRTAWHCNARMEPVVPNVERPYTSLRVRAY
jgi:hypothetical protein